MAGIITNIGQRPLSTTEKPPPRPSPLPSLLLHVVLILGIALSDLHPPERRVRRGGVRGERRGLRQRHHLRLQLAPVLQVPVSLSPHPRRTHISTTATARGGLWRLINFGQRLNLVKRKSVGSQASHSRRREELRTRAKERESEIDSGCDDVGEGTVDPFAWQDEPFEILPTTEVVPGAVVVQHFGIETEARAKVSADYEAALRVRSRACEFPGFRRLNIYRCAQQGVYFVVSEWDSHEDARLFVQRNGASVTSWNLPSDLRESLKSVRTVTERIFRPVIWHESPQANALEYQRPGFAKYDTHPMNPMYSVESFEQMWKENDKDSLVHYPGYKRTVLLKEYQERPKDPRIPFFGTSYISMQHWRSEDEYTKMLEDTLPPGFYKDEAMRRVSREAAMGISKPDYYREFPISTYLESISLETPATVLSAPIDLSNTQTPLIPSPLGDPIKTAPTISLRMNSTDIN